MPYINILEVQDVELKENLINLSSDNFTIVFNDEMDFEQVDLASNGNGSEVGGNTSEHRLDEVENSCVLFAWNQSHNQPHRLAATQSRTHQDCRIMGKVQV
jgi:hypothetical protein